MEPEGSLSHFQVTATCPYPEPDQSSPHPHIPLPEDLCFSARIQNPNTEITYNDEVLNGTIMLTEYHILTVVI
jgi:hypothetical protein